MSGSPSRTDRLHGELGPDILPRQLRALELIAARLDAERPTPSLQLRERLGPVLGELERGTLGRWQVPAWAYIASGLAVLLVTALLAL